MIRAGDFIDPARQLGFRTWAGVPCSFLTPFINSVIDDPGALEQMLVLAKGQRKIPVIVDGERVTVGFQGKG